MKVRPFILLVVLGLLLLLSLPRPRFEIPSLRTFKQIAQLTRVLEPSGKALRPSLDSGRDRDKMGHRQPLKQQVPGYLNIATTLVITDPGILSLWQFAAATRDPDQRMDAVMLLEGLDGQDATCALLKLYEEEPDPKLASYLLYTLLRRGGPGNT
jgi:hypothetical protein